MLRSAVDDHPSVPRGHRVLRPSHCPLPARARSTTIRAIATKFLRPSSSSSFSPSPSFSTLKIYYSCELWKRCCSRKSTALEGEQPPKSHETDRPTDRQPCAVVELFREFSLCPLSPSPSLPLVLSHRSDPSPRICLLSFSTFAALQAPRRSSRRLG